ncbi:MAG: hypothetical protein MUO76_12455, partial [Anaerolineaceae bacterium]|nr:hypothetical protein [Anaerolineaceae bacterium]
NEKTLQLTITDPSKNDVVVSSALIQDAFLPGIDPRGKEFIFDLYPPLMLDSELTYRLHLSVLDGLGELSVYGSKQADESTWDDKLPIGLDGYNPFDYYNGVYRTDLNFEMYWEDNIEQLERFY